MRSAHRRHLKRSRGVVPRGCNRSGPNKGPLPRGHPCPQAPPPTGILPVPLLPRPLWAGQNGEPGIHAGPAVFLKTWKPPNPPSTPGSRSVCARRATNRSPSRADPSVGWASVQPRIRARRARSAGPTPSPRPAVGSGLVAGRRTRLVRARCERYSGAEPGLCPRCPAPKTGESR